MAKRSVGSIMRKKLSDITNSQSQPKLSIQEEKSLETFPTEKDCIEQLLKERVTLIQLLAERNKTIELSGAELQRLRDIAQKLQLQNWNLAQSNSQMLAELNLKRERIKALQLEISCRAALLKGMNLKVEEGDEKAGPSLPKACNDENHCNTNRRRSTGSSTASTKNASKEKVDCKRTQLRRHSARIRRHEYKDLENLFEIEDAKYPLTLSGSNLLSSAAVQDETGGNSGFRMEAPRSSFGRPLRKAVERVQSYKEPTLKVKMRRLE